MKTKLITRNEINMITRRGWKTVATWSQSHILGGCLRFWIKKTNQQIFSTRDATVEGRRAGGSSYIIPLISLCLLGIFPLFLISSFFLCGSHLSHIWLLFIRGFRPLKQFFTSKTLSILFFSAETWKESIFCTKCCRVSAQQTLYTFWTIAIGCITCRKRAP